MPITLTITPSMGITITIMITTPAIHTAMVDKTAAAPS